MLCPKVQVVEQPVHSSVFFVYTEIAVSFLNESHDPFCLNLVIYTSVNSEEWLSKQRMRDVHNYMSNMGQYHTGFLTTRVIVHYMCASQ